MNFGQIVRRSAKRFADKVAVIDVAQNKELTFSQLNVRINRLANSLLDMGIRKGDRVAFLQWNGHQIVECIYALAKIGVIRVPINARFTQKNIHFI